MGLHKSMKIWDFIKVDKILEKYMYGSFIFDNVEALQPAALLPKNFFIRDLPRILITV